MSKPEGMIRLSVLAAENGITLRCLKRRLLKLDKRIRRDSPEGPFCLHHGADNGAYSADAAVLYMHARGYLHARLRKEPLLEIRDLLLEMRDDHDHVQHATVVQEKEAMTITFRGAAIHGTARLVR